MYDTRESPPHVRGGRGAPIEKHRWTRCPDLPYEVVENILLLKLPMKSLMRFRCVCKRWRDLITLRYRNFLTTDGKHVFSLSGDNLNRSDRWVFPYFADGSYLCLRGHANGIVFASTWSDDTYVMWNPATSQYKALPRLPSSPYTTRVYFGFNSKTDDYNVLRVINFQPRVDLYSRRADSWKKIQTSLPFAFRDEHYSCDSSELEFDYNQHRAFKCEHGCVDGAFFWFGLEPKRRRKGVVLFHIAEEEFKFVEIPSSLAQAGSYFGAALFKESIAIIGQIRSSNAVEMWVMKDFGDPGSWVQRFSVDMTGYLIHAFISSGEFIVYDKFSKSTAFWCPIAQQFIRFSLPHGTAHSVVINYRESFVSL